MYFEKAIVKTYYRNYKDKKVPYNQLHLGSDSKFNENPEEPDEVAVIKLLDFESLSNDNGLTKLNEMEAKYKELQEEKLQLEKKVEELTSTAKSLASDVNKYKEETIQLQEKLLKAEDKNEDIIQLQKQHKEELSDKDSEITELNSKLNNEKDYSKALLIALLDSYKRGMVDRIRNIEPESTTKVLALRPIEIEAEVHEEKEE